MSPNGGFPVQDKFTRTKYILRKRTIAVRNQLHSLNQQGCNQLNTASNNTRNHFSVVRHRAHDRFGVARDRARYQFDLACERFKPALAGNGRRMLLAVVLLLGLALGVVTTGAALPDSDSAPAAAPAAARANTPIDETALLEHRSETDRADRAARSGTVPPPVANGESADQAIGEDAEQARATGPEESSEPEATESNSEETASEEAQQRDWVHPMSDSRTTSCWGPRWGTFHAGVDLAAPEGTPIHAVGAGTVTHAGWVFPGYGISVVIHHPNGYQTHYAHASEATVSAGDQVTPGQVIALEGSTGDSTGPHLHFEVHQGMWNRLDPAPWLADRGVHINGC